MQDEKPIRRILTAKECSAGAAVQLASEVILVIAWDGSSRLIDLGGSCYGLPAVSTSLLEAVLNSDVDDAVRAVAGRYAVNEETVRADFDSFHRDLLRKGILTKPLATSGRRGLFQRIKTGPIGCMLRLILRVFRSDTRRARALLAFASASLKVLGWAKTVEIWRDVTTLKVDCIQQVADPARVEAIGQAVRDALSRSVIPADCKARALCGWAMLRAAGQPAQLFVGVELFPFLGHCWCESESRPLSDGGDRSGRFIPVLQYS